MLVQPQLDRLNRELLEDLAPDASLRDFLPRAAVEVGDEWRVDAKTYGQLRSPSGYLHFRFEGLAKEADRSKQWIDNLTGAIVARYAGTRRVLERELAVIELEIAVPSSVDLTAEPQSGLTVAEAGEIHFEQRGELLWDLANERAHSVEIEGEMILAIEKRLEREQEGKRLERIDAQRYEGTEELTMSFD